MSTLCTLLVAGTAALLVPFLARAAEAPASIVITNGKILTMDEASSTVEALAIRDGRFVYVGNNYGVRDFIGDGTRVIDAHGKSVVPGFLETHTHAIGVARGDHLL